MNTKHFKEHGKIRAKVMSFHELNVFIIHVKVERQSEPSSSLSFWADYYRREMDQIMNKVGSYWLGQKANKEFNSVGDDFNSLSSSIEGGTKWLVNKLKGKMQKPLPELLKEFGLPVGIFPQDATNYEFNEETGKLTVFIPETRVASGHSRFLPQQSIDVVPISSSSLLSYLSQEAKTTLV
ncbi:hypothetical protein Bca52824_009209 [Brassica carinata]|uniref:Uncharacterized protein n=1 Tax=Brassica carinata TaxID=52824 RepID=A0A8X7WAM4_BRACI|nr:hypothetical protein Bca52824_009209 [Brassica carinata]